MASVLRSLSFKVQPCEQCKKNVLPFEKMTVDGKVYHNNCFRCTYCQKVLRVNEFVTIGDEKRVYCLPHAKHGRLNLKEEKGKTKSKRVSFSDTVSVQEYEKEEEDLDYSYSFETSFKEDDDEDEELTFTSSNSKKVGFSPYDKLQQLITQSSFEKEEIPAISNNEKLEIIATKEEQNVARASTPPPDISHSPQLSTKKKTKKERKLEDTGKNIFNWGFRKKLKKKEETVIVDGYTSVPVVTFAVIPESHAPPPLAVPPTSSNNLEPVAIKLESGQMDTTEIDGMSAEADNKKSKKEKKKKKHKKEKHNDMDGSNPVEHKSKKEKKKKQQENGNVLPDPPGDPELILPLEPAPIEVLASEGPTQNGKEETDLNVVMEEGLKHFQLAVSVLQETNHEIPSLSPTGIRRLWQALPSFIKANIDDTIVGVY